MIHILQLNIKSHRVGSRPILLNRQKPLQKQRYLVPS